MKTLLKVTVFILVASILTSCDFLGLFDQNGLYGFRVDDAKVKPLETAVCDKNGVVELTPLQDGDAVVRAQINGKTTFLATTTYQDSERYTHRRIAQPFVSGITFSVSARGSDSQVIPPVLTVTCP